MKNYRHWVLLTLAMAVLPSLFRLPLWASGIAFAGACLHYLEGVRRGWPGRLATASMLGLTVAGILYSFESWFSGDAVLCFFISVVFLKWSEASTRRDFLLLIFAAVILAAVGTLYWRTCLTWCTCCWWSFC